MFDGIVEYSLMFRLKVDDSLWELCNYTKGWELGKLKHYITKQRKFYPQYEWKIVGREVSDWWDEEE